MFRLQALAHTHYKKVLQGKVLSTWRIFTDQQTLDRDMKQTQEATQSKMATFLAKAERKVGDVTSNHSATVTDHGDATQRREVRMSATDTDHGDFLA